MAYNGWINRMEAIGNRDDPLIGGTTGLLYTREANEYTAVRKSSCNDLLGE